MVESRMKRPQITHTALSSVGHDHRGLERPTDLPEQRPSLVPEPIR